MSLEFRFLIVAGANAGIGTSMVLELVQEGANAVIDSQRVTTGR
jgi:NAD(P)-dependent dehydrogenase (short-subunit alcohol dehydrogenase family)